MQTKKITIFSIAAGCIVFLLLVLWVFFSNFSSFLLSLRNDDITISNTVSAIEGQYGVQLNFPSGWVVEDCSPESKRYLNGHVRYICRFVSPPYPGTNRKTYLYIFAHNKKKNLTQEELINFVRERQEYGWAGEINRNPEISVVFDKTFDSISHDKWSGIRIDDLVEHRGPNQHFNVWVSNIIQSSLLNNGVILSINHSHEQIPPPQVPNAINTFVTQDVLQYVKISDN